MFPHPKVLRGPTARARAEILLRARRQAANNAGADALGSREHPVTQAGIRYLSASDVAKMCASSRGTWRRCCDGIALDPANPSGPLTAGDFTFRTGTNNAPHMWAPGPTPTGISTMLGAGWPAWIGANRPARWG